MKYGQTGRTEKGESAMASCCCWCGRDRRNQTVSRRALVVICSFLLLATIKPKVAADLATETNVLLEMKRVWKNTLRLSSWSNDTSTCNGWVGVTCDDLNTTVTYLDLSGISLGTVIPTIIGNLTNLTIVRLSGCSLSGEIPRTIGSLKNLTILGLGENALNSSIPAELGNLTNLTSLDLGQNTLTGNLPDLSQLQALQSLVLGPNNELTGPLPRWLGGLSQLQSLILIITNFTGSIPPEIGNLTNLRQLTLESSGLSGVLPPELGKLETLRTMQMNSNGFTGSIPDAFSNLQSLRSMVLSENKLNGSLGSWFGNLHSLTEIDLDKNVIEGPIPAEFGSLLNLTKIVLSNNQLTGEIPASLGNLINLIRIDLQNNLLTGPVPSSILSLPNLVLLTLDNNCLNGLTPVNQTNGILEGSYAGNCFNDSSQPGSCRCPSAVSPSSEIPSNTINRVSSSNNSKIYISVGVVLGTLLALAILILIYLRCRRRHKELPPPGSVKRYKLSEIKEGTKNFSVVIGKGGQATVYKAEFKDGSVAAVKRFGYGVEHKKRKSAIKSFDQEVRLLARLNHRFLVNVIGYCEEEEEYMILFEYMDKGSLYDHLHGKYAAQTSFTWEERVAIINNVGRGIDYLHYGSSPPVFHRDIKSANILLSSERKLAKVADFGLGQLTTIDPSAANVDFTAGAPKPEPDHPMGSHGYMDPNFFKTAMYSEKSDIYSYGVVLLELITGRKALEKGEILTDWVRPSLDEPTDFLKIVDPKLEGRYVQEELIAVGETALRCIDGQSDNRPTIRDILQKLRSVFEKQTTGTSPSQRTISSSVDFSGIESNFSGDLPNYSINSYTKSEFLPRE